MFGTNDAHVLERQAKHLAEAPMGLSDGLRGQIDCQPPRPRRRRRQPPLAASIGCALSRPMASVSSTTTGARSSAARTLAGRDDEVIRHVGSPPIMDHRRGRGVHARHPPRQAVGHIRRRPLRRHPLPRRRLRRRSTATGSPTKRTTSAASGVGATKRLRARRGLPGRPLEHLRQLTSLENAAITPGTARCRRRVDTDDAVHGDGRAADDGELGHVLERRSLRVLASAGQEGHVLRCACGARRYSVCSSHPSTWAFPFAPHNTSTAPAHEGLVGGDVFAPTGAPVRPARRGAGQPSAAMPRQLAPRKRRACRRNNHRRGHKSAAWQAGVETLVCNLRDRYISRYQDESGGEHTMGDTERNKKCRAQARREARMVASICIRRRYVDAPVAG